MAMRRSARIAQLDKQVVYQEPQWMEESDQEFLHESEPEEEEEEEEELMPIKPIASTSRAVKQKHAITLHPHPTRLSQFPIEIIERIMMHMDAKSLLHFATLHRNFLTVVHQDHFTQTFIDCHTDLPKKEITSVPFLRFLSLIFNRGCEICHAKRIRLIYWPHLVRCCAACLFNNTTSEYRLKDKRVDPKVLARLPYNMGNFYSKRRHCQYELKFYWTSRVNREVEVYKQLSKRSGFQQSHQQTVNQMQLFMQQANKQERALKHQKAEMSDVVGEDRAFRQQEIIRKFRQVYPEASYYVLRPLPSFQRACKLATPLTERAWKLLFKKLNQEYLEQGQR